MLIVMKIVRGILCVYSSSGFIIKVQFRTMHDWRNTAVSIIHLSRNKFSAMSR